MEFPEELRRSVPRMIRELADRRFIAVVLLAYAPLLYRHTTDPSGWQTLIPCVAGPLLAALFLTLRPLNPYESLFAELEGKTWESMNDDPAAQRFVMLLGSGDAKRLTWKTGTLSSAAFSLIVWLGSTFVETSKSWDHGRKTYEAVLILSLLWALLSAPLLYYALLRWVLRQWASRNVEQ